MPACLAFENVQKYASLGGFTISKIHEHDIYDTKMPTNLACEKLCCVWCCIFLAWEKKIKDQPYLWGELVEEREEVYVFFPGEQQ